MRPRRKFDLQDIFSHQVLHLERLTMMQSYFCDSRRARCAQVYVNWPSNACSSSSHLRRSALAWRRCRCCMSSSRLSFGASSV